MFLYKNFTFEKKIIALHEISKASLKMALTAFVEKQPESQEQVTTQQELPKDEPQPKDPPKDEPKPEEPPKDDPEPKEPPKPKLPEPVQQQIIKSDPVPVPIEPDIRENTETTTQENTQPTQTQQTQTQTAASAASTLQAQNSGDEAESSSASEDDHIIAIIRAAIDKEAKKNYPSKARQLRMEGIATIKIRIDKNGQITLLEIVKSSGFAMLDTSAIESIEKASKKFPKPTHDLLFTLPISYKII
ncbi:MAG: energy transducer TonB [Campylobacteraceae bacterium]|nr:energy transducer TonB [Campylobacteraceae bacterium]